MIYKRYIVDMDLSDYDLSISDERGWRNASYLSAEGDTWEEVYNDAEIFWTDEDGENVFDEFLKDLVYERELQSRIEMLLKLEYKELSDEGI